MKYIKAKNIIKKLENNHPVKLKGSLSKGINKTTWDTIGDVLLSDNKYQSIGYKPNNIGGFTIYWCDILNNTVVNANVEIY